MNINNKIIFLDSGSSGYCKTLFDECSFNYLLENYLKINSVIDRYMMV